MQKPSTRFTPSPTDMQVPEGTQFLSPTLPWGQHLPSIYANSGRPSARKQTNTQTDADPSNQGSLGEDMASPGPGRRQDPFLSSPPGAQSPREETRCFTYQVFLQGGEWAMHDMFKMLLQSFQFWGVRFVET